MKSSFIKKFLIGLIGVFIIIQFIPVDRSNPESDPALDFIAIEKPNEEIANMIQTSCYDCHSNKTTYPWYAYVAPVSMILSHHVEEAREHLNFSVWGNYSEKQKEHKLEEFEEEVEEGEMPLSSYTAFHGDAKLSQEQVKTLLTWVEGKE